MGVEAGVGDDLPLPERLAFFWESEYVDAVVAPLMLGMAGVLASPWTAGNYIRVYGLFVNRLLLPCKADSVCLSVSQTESACKKQVHGQMGRHELHCLCGCTTRLQGTLR